MTRNPKLLSSGGADGRPRSLNNQGQLAYKATFSNGDEALVLYSPDSPDSSADFDGDTDVDGDDLARWKTHFGASPNATQGQGDAIDDGVVDGEDFLAWQRQLTANSNLTSLAIPGPAGAEMLALGACLTAAVVRRRPIASARRPR